MPGMEGKWPPGPGHSRMKDRRQVMQAGVFMDVARLNFVLRNHPSLWPHCRMSVIFRSSRCHARVILFLLLQTSRDACRETSFRHRPCRPVSARCARHGTKGDQPSRQRHRREAGIPGRSGALPDGFRACLWLDPSQSQRARAGCRPGAAALAGSADNCGPAHPGFRTGQSFRLAPPAPARTRSLTGRRSHVRRFSR